MYNSECEIARRSSPRAIVLGVVGEALDDANGDDEGD